MDLKQSLLQHYRWLRQYGINDSHSGNASARQNEQVWITPTGACADTLQEEDLIACQIDKTIPDKASLDAALHLAVYRKNPAANAVLHSHGAHTVALTMNGEDFIPPDFEGQYYFSNVPVLNLPYENCIADAVEAVSDALQHSPVAIVRGHGVYVQAETINLAYKWTCSLELSAKTTFIARMAGTIGPGN